MIDVSLNVQFASISIYVIHAKTVTNIAIMQMISNYFVILYILKQAFVNLVVINSIQRGVIHFMFTIAKSVYTMPSALIAISYKDITTMMNTYRRYYYETTKFLSHSCKVLCIIGTGNSNMDSGT